MSFQFVKKRDGQTVPFDQPRITKAILKAFEATKEGNEKDAEKISDRVCRSLEKKFAADRVLGIEEIQDAVETQLILGDYPKTAKAYILYREERSKLRELRKQIPEYVKRLAEESKKYFRNPLGEFVYYRSYSRWLDSTEGRRETWIETVSRYLDFMKENLGQDLSDKEYEEIRGAALRQEVVPSMRLLWSAGEAARKSNVTGYNCSYIAPTKLEDFGEIMYLSMCGAGVGFSVEHQTVEKLPQIKRQGGKKLPTHVIEDSKEGWATALVLGMKTWFEGKDISFDFSSLRPQGARLKTMGGKSSGPGPLMAVLEFSKKKILAKQGRRLTPIDAHDIICKIGEVVVMGGVRRSALLSLSDLDDPEMRAAKTGQFYLTEPQRMMANNSAAYNEKPPASVFMDEWIALAKSGTGERGIFNRGGLPFQLPARRWKGGRNGWATAGTNPCVTADTWVMTSEGAKLVSELIHSPFTAIVGGMPYPASGFWRTGEKEVFEVITNRGFSFKATADHPALTLDYRSRKVQRNVWKKVKELAIGDELVLHNHENLSWEGRGNEKEGWLLGSLLGDGNIEKNGKVNLDYWGKTQSIMMQKALNYVHATVGRRNDFIGHVSKTGYARIGSVGVGVLAASYGMTYARKAVTEEIEKSSSDFYKGFLQGWFDADGSVQGNHLKGVSIRLSSNSISNLKAAQRMLLRLGIASSIYQNRRLAQTRLMPDGKGGMREYLCQANHELIISGKNIESFSKRVSFNDPEKANKLNSILVSYSRLLNRENFSAKITDIKKVGKELVYDCIVETAHAFDGNGFYLHNCGEIILKSREFCNLTEVVARAEDTEETLLKKVKIATILGAYQSSLTDFPFLSKEWKKNCEEERLLGVSITGQWDCPAVRNAATLRKLREYALEINRIYSEKMGINSSLAITCVKPSGTVSQLVDAASGLHPRHAPYYIRRIRIAATDALFEMLRDQKVPYYPEVGQSGDNVSTYVLEFPVKAPAGSVFRNDLTAIEQLEYWKLVKENFTEHNPSVTISVGSNEWIVVANWLYEHWDMLGGLSFLPREDHVYALAPYEEISKERYEKLLKNFPKIDYSQILLYEKDDETQGAKELACAAGVCEIF